MRPQAAQFGGVAGDADHHKVRGWRLLERMQNARPQAGDALDVGRKRFHRCFKDGFVSRRKIQCGNLTRLGKGEIPRRAGGRKANQLLMRKRLPSASDGQSEESREN